MQHAEDRKSIKRSQGNGHCRESARDRKGARGDVQRTESAHAHAHAGSGCGFLDVSARLWAVSRAAEPLRSAEFGQVRRYDHR